MLPENRLSSVVVPAPLVGGRGNPNVGNTRDFESGGRALNDASEGLQSKVWEGWIENDSEIWIVAPGVLPTKVVEDSNITEFSFTFDQLMRVCVSYVSDGVVKLYWYDSSAGAMVTTTFTGISSPRVSLDNKTDQATLAGTSDVIFAYIRDNNLCYRQQRERYATERVLKSSLGSNQIQKVGMNRQWRFQFICYYP